jgi:predicted ester cyclase
MEIERSEFVLDELSGFTSCDWREWDEEEAFEQLETPSVFDFDVGGLDSFLLSTGDDLSSTEPFYSFTTTSPVETTFSIGSPVPEVIGNTSNTLTMTFSPKSEPMKKQTSKENHRQSKFNSGSTTNNRTRSRKRKNVTNFEEESSASSSSSSIVQGKKNKTSFTSQETIKNKEIEDKLYRKRYDILHGILEAWNTGGIEDMEEIAPNVYHDDVVLISPDYTEGLHGVKAIMEHWANLLDAFPDGIMEEYNIEKEDTNGEKIQVSWIFGGTQISPFKGVAPRHEKVCIRGKTFFTFKEDKICSMVLTWNYRETLLTLLGIKDATNENIVLSAHVKK